MFAPASISPFTKFSVASNEVAPGTGEGFVIVKYLFTDFVLIKPDVEIFG